MLDVKFDSEAERPFPYVFELQRGMSIMSNELAKCENYQTLALQIVMTRMEKTLDRLVARETREVARETREVVRETREVARETREVVREAARETKEAVRETMDF